MKEALGIREIAIEVDLAEVQVQVRETTQKMWDRRVKELFLLLRRTRLLHSSESNELGERYVAMN